MQTALGNDILEFGLLLSKGNLNVKNRMSAIGTYWWLLFVSRAASVGAIDK